MMHTSIYSKYLIYSYKNKVDPIECVNPDHPFLMPNINIEDDKIFLYCPKCSYRFYPGEEFYNKIKTEVEKLENEED